MLVLFCEGKILHPFWRFVDPTFSHFYILELIIFLQECFVDLYLILIIPVNYVIDKDSLLLDDDMIGDVYLLTRVVSNHQIAGVFFISI